MRLKGLEPPRLSAPDPKSGAATNYATAALWFAGAKINKILFSAIAFGLLFEIIFYTEPMQRQIFRQTNARFPYKLWLRLLIRTT